jgi:O-antigen/teichoic acid export membrane protein
MSDASVGKNIWFASIGTVIPSIFTYLFWFLTAIIAGPAAVGFVSSLSAFSLIIITIVSLDTSIGMKRYLGIATGEEDRGKFKKILFSTLVFISITIAVFLGLLAFPSLSILEIFSIDRAYYWILVMMVIFTSFNNTFTEALVSALQSRALLSPLIIGSILRFPVLLLAYYFLQSTYDGIALSYISLYMVSTLCYAAHLVKYLKGSARFSLGDFSSYLKPILASGTAGWIPHVINVLGSQLSILTVFAVVGSAEAGKFYIPQAIFTFALFTVSGITRVSHPLIAGMRKDNDQVSFLRYTLKLAYILTMPFAAALMFFSYQYLSILGGQFGAADITLKLFMANIPLAILSEMVYYFAYGKGNNRVVLYLGLFGNVPRILLYFILIPFLDANGAAIAYLVGTMCQTAWSIIVIKRVYQFSLDYKTYIVLSMIPLLLGFMTTLLQVQFILASFIVIVGSLLIFIRLGLVSDNEYRTVLFSVLPDRICRRIYPLGLVFIRSLSKKKVME